MKKIVLILCTLIIVLFSNSPVFAVCAPGSSWLASWTDQFGQTTYTLEAPCKVYIGIPFAITATVTDDIYPDDYVAACWSIIDNGSVIAGESGFNWLETVNGQWQDILDVTYSGTPVDHTLQFNFIDLGQGTGGHFWGAELIGDVTVDPYPPSANNPPTADAGPDIDLASENQRATVINGTAHDADGNPLTYRWLEGNNVLQWSTAVDASGNAPLNLSVIPPLSTGAHTFTLEVSDGIATVTDSMVVSVENSPPTAAPSGGGTFQIGENISLKGTVADYDGDTLSYSWLEGETVLAEGVVPTSPGGSPAALPEYLIVGGLPLGPHTLTLRVSDGIDIVSENITVNVVDTIAPTLAPTASTSILWPPSGGMTEVTINANAHDNSGKTVLLGVRVSTNEPPRTDKAGNIIPDYSIVRIDQSAGVIVLRLRTARSGHGGDRIYSIFVTAADVSGNSATAEVLIKAPHDRGVHRKQAASFMRTRKR